MPFSVYHRHSLLSTCVSCEISLCTAALPVLYFISNHRRAGKRRLFMDAALKQDSMRIMQSAIRAVLPERAVFRALEDQRFSGRVVLVAVGKAAWQMAKAAHD